MTGPDIRTGVNLDTAPVPRHEINHFPYFIYDHSTTNDDFDEDPFDGDDLSCMAVTASGGSGAMVREEFNSFATNCGLLSTSTI